MTVRELTKEITDMLEKAGDASSAFECGVICEDMAGLPRGAASLVPETPVSEDGAARALEAAKRRAAGEPLQYILGRWEFWGLPFYVGPGVLIPRPETELLVECVLSHIGRGQNAAIADLCSGSGCVAIAVGKERPDATVYALEKSPEALAYLKRNIALNGVKNVAPRLADVLDYGGGLWELDCVVSNPPYVRTGEIPSLQREVAAEPRMALDGGEDGLRFYRGIAEGWRARVRDGGLMALEIGEDQPEDVVAILEQAGWRGAVVKRDYAGLPRVVTAKKERPSV